MRAVTDLPRIRLLMERLGRSAKSPGCVYFTGGVSAVLLGWRDTTLDADLKGDPEPGGFFEALARLKDEVDINIELAAPDQFVPALPEWRERSLPIEQHGRVEFRHYDFYGQALSKIERNHPRDRLDVASMVRTGLVVPKRLLDLYARVESEVVRYPAVEAVRLRKRLVEFASNAEY